MTETWRPVPDFEGLYEVSDLGRVRSLARKVAHRNTLMTVPSRVLKATWSGGYAWVGLCRDGEQWNRHVHVLVAAAFLGQRPAGLVVCHGSGGACDNRVINLRYDTQSANMFDRVKDGNDPQSQRSSCPRGHELAEPNLMPSQLRRGKRSCLACSRARTFVKQPHNAHLDFERSADAYYERIMRTAQAEEKS